MFALAMSSVLVGASGCAARKTRDPEQSFALYQVAVSSFEGDRIEAARGEAEKALKADPENAEAHHLLGLIALRQGAQYTAQLQMLDCLRGAEAELVREDAHRRYREATEHFRRAVALRGDYAIAWNNLSVAALNLQEWDEAIEAASRALEIGTYGEPWVASGNRGWAYLHKRQLQSAWRDLHDAVARQPAFCVGRYRLAKVYLERGQFEDAAEQVEAVLAESRCPIQEAHLLGGMLADKLGQPERALELWTSCVALAPRSCTAGECRRYAAMIH